MGFSVETQRVSGDKETRADPVSSVINRGDCYVVLDESWNRDFVEELRTFPRGAHDDIVDALSDAYNTLADAPPDLSKWLDAM
jgi:predicted phage terminase large subunit-like protein